MVGRRWNDKIVRVCGIFVFFFGLVAPVPVEVGKKFVGQNILLPFGLESILAALQY